MITPSRPLFVAAVLLASFLVLAACQQDAEVPAAVVAERVESPALGLAIADLPAAFTVTRNDAGALVLSPAAGEGRLELVNESPDAGLNLVTAVEDHKAEIETREGGDYKGGRELVTQLGAAYYTRGRYLEDGTLMEESAIVFLHPSQEHKSRLVYRYPAGDDSKERLESMFELLGELEGVDQGGVVQEL